MTAPGLSCSLWDLVPWPGVEPGPSALGEWSLSHWTTREVLRFQFADILGKIQLWWECWPHRGSTADLFRVMERYYSFAVVVITCLCLVAQSCLTLCNPLDCSPPGSSVHGDSPGKNIGMGCHALHQGIFPTQRSNPGPQHCRRILYHLSHQRSPKNTGMGKLSLLQGNFVTQELNRGLLHCRQIHYLLSYPGSLVTCLCLSKLRTVSLKSVNFTACKLD